MHTTVQLKVIQKPPPQRATVTQLLTSTVFKKALVTLRWTSLCKPLKHSSRKPPIQRPKIKPRSRKSQQKCPDKTAALNNCSETLTLVNTLVFSLHPASIFIREDCFISSHCLSEQVSSTFFLLREPYLHPHCPLAYKQWQPPGNAGFLCSISCCSVLHTICGPAVTGGLISSLSWGQCALSEHLPKEHEGVQLQQLASGLFILPLEKTGCVADFVCIFLLPLHTCQKRTKQQSSHQVWKGAGRERREFCARLSGSPLHNSVPKEQRVC